MLEPKNTVKNMNGYFVPLYEREWEFKLDSNENNYGPSKKVIEALKNCNYKNISFYPYYGELSQKIADYNNVNIENIKVTNGADEALGGIIQTYLNEGEYLLTLDVSFEMPVIYTQIQGGKIKKVPFKTKWEFPVNEFLNELNNDKIKIIYIASPNNPTGNTVSKENMDLILAKSKDKVVIIDETYANYCDKSFKQYIKEYDNVFIVRSFSKDFALAGLRLGYIISNEENIKNLKKVISPYSVNAYAVMAGINALEDIPYLYQIKNEINQSKEDLKEFFTELGAVVYNSEANFLLIDFKNKAEFVYRKLINENISVKLFKKGTLLENHLRITIPTKEGVKRIKSALKIKPALVFDMDGVLINASNSYRTTIEKTYEKYTGKKADAKEIQKIKNMGGMNNDWDLTKFLIEREGIHIDYSEITETFQKIYWDNGKGLINNENFLFNTDLIKRLSKDYNLSIFTGRFKEEALYALKRFKVEDYFYPIITTNDIPTGREKPHPDGLNLTKELTMAESYYYFGDTPDDIKSAKSAGYKAIGVLPPQDKSDDLKNILKSTGADYILNSINDIEIILETNNETVH